MAKTKKNIKYSILNVSKNEYLVENTTKKATLEWLQEAIESLNDDEQLKFATLAYGAALPNYNFDKSVIIEINKIAGRDRLKKLMNKDLPIKNNIYRIEETKNKEEEKE